MQGGNNGEGKCGAQEDGARNPDPALRPNARQHDEENGGDLRKGVCLAENAGSKITQSGDSKQHRAGRQDGNIAAEYQHGKLPWNLVQDGEHKKHGAQQQLIRDRVEILAEESLLMQLTSQQAIQAIAEACNHEEYQSSKITSLHQFDHNKWNENHPQ